MNGKESGDAPRTAARRPARRRTGGREGQRRRRDRCLVWPALLLVVVLASAGGALGNTLGAHGEASRSAIAARAAKPKPRCPRGHVLLALRGPRLIRARPEGYTVLAHACANVPRLVRFTIAGPQRVGWRVRHLRAHATVKHGVRLRFAPLVSASSPTFAILTIEARSRGGRLLGRLRVKVVYIEGPPREAALGGVTVGWGVNFRGEAGGGFRSGPLTRPVQGGLHGVREVAAGLNSGFALLNDGTVRAWGANGDGQLGDGTRAESLTPVRVLGLSHVTQIAASGNHVLALLENGTVMVWGADFWGNLGNGTRDTVEGTAHPIPQPVPGLSGVVAVAAGGADDLAVLSNGAVLAWGEDKNGQLGDGATGTKLVPTPVKNLAGVRAITIGGVASLGGHMLALLNDGQVMVAGQNDHGQLGLGDTVERHTPVPLPGVANATSIAAGITHSLVALANGTVLSWGADAEGELGYAAPQTCSTAPCAESPHPVPLSGVRAVAAGKGFSVALAGARVLSWGENELGQLGNGNTVQSTAPVEVAGITGIATITASEKFTLALAELGPAPDFTLRPGPGALIAEWTPAPGPEGWGISWRVAAHPQLPWGKPVNLPPSAHSYVIGGLSRVLYEVKLVRLNTSGDRRIAYGVPE